MKVNTNEKDLEVGAVDITLENEEFQVWIKCGNERILFAFHKDENEIVGWVTKPIRTKTYRTNK